MSDKTADAHAAKAGILTCLEQYDEAFESHKRSYLLDPNSFHVRYLYGSTYLLVGRYAEAAGHLERAVQLADYPLSSINFLSMCYEGLDQHSKSFEISRKILEFAERVLAGNAADAYALKSGLVALGKIGDVVQARQWAQRLRALSPGDPSIIYDIACAMAHLGALDEALEASSPLLEPVIFANWIRRDPDFKALRDLPRFHDILTDLDARAEAARKPATN